MHLYSCVATIKKFVYTEDINVIAVEHYQFQTTAVTTQPMCSRDTYKILHFQNVYKLLI